MKWIVTVDRAEARIFKAKPFVRIQTLKNDLGREKSKAMTTDKPGMARSRLAQPSSTHALTGEKNPHEEAAVQFARRLARFLEHEGKAGRFDKLLVVSEPKMMGRIRKTLKKDIIDNCEWLKKDLAHFTDHEIGEVFGLNWRKPVTKI